MSLLLPDSGLLFWMLLSFGVVFVVLAKYGFPVITKMVEGRRTYIDQSLEVAKEANAQLQRLKAESEALVAAANKEQGRILREAMHERDKIIVEARKQAEVEMCIRDRAVIDDPQSIIRCTNKVYLKELFEKEKIPAPLSMLLFKSNVNSYEEITEQLGSPFILKIPDGSFSIGMKKVNNKEELDEALKVLFDKSSILLAQEFTPTDFDWRIGILNGEPLYACKYYMAKGHWQIYCHYASGRSRCGLVETIPIYQVPRKVLDTALRAASFIGKGLYLSLIHIFTVHCRKVC